jgi:hypothetical protein
MDGAWKFVEKTGFVLSLIMTAGILLYTAGLYYGWNESKGSATAGASGMTAVTSEPVWVWVLGAIGVALLLSSLVMIVVRSPLTADISTNGHRGKRRILGDPKERVG